MKKLLAILVVSVALAAWGCGTDDAQTDSGGERAAQTSSSGKDAAQTSSNGEKEEEQAGEGEEERLPVVVADAPRNRFATITLGQGKTQPKLHPSSEPPPKRMMIRDLAIGTGPVARLGDKVSIYYYSVDYKTHERKYFRWPPQETLNTPLISAEPWHLAVVGMRAGGQREMIIPVGLFSTSMTLDYFVEMVRVNGQGGSRQPKS